MHTKRISFLLAAAILFAVFAMAFPAGVSAAVSSAAFENFSMNVGSDETERNFIWHSDSQNGSVEYAVRNGNAFPSEYTSVPTRLTEFNGKTVHRATIFGLEYDTEYVYRLRSGDTVSESIYFTTDPKDHFNFIFVGDPQMGSGNLNKDITTWTNTLSAALDMFPESSLLVSAGDQVEDSLNPSYFSAFLAPEQLSSLAIATSIGNHDYDSNFYKNYFNNPNTTVDGKVYGQSHAGGDYWYTYNNVLFMHINSCNISWDEHKEFMQKAIAANPNVGWKVVVTHYNFFGSNGYFINESIKERREQFAPIMQELDIDVVLAGHEHVNSRAYMIDGLTADTAQGNATSVTDPTGVLYLSGGSPSGSKFYKLIDDELLPHIAFKLQDTVTFTNIEVDTYSFKITTYRASDRAVLDTFEIKKDKNAVETDYENHTHTEGEWTDIYAATYHFEGLRAKRCPVCGAAYEYEYVPKLEREEGNDNVALGKKYERSGLFLDDGYEKYPDEDGTTMTDGFFAPETAIYNDAAYIGFHKSYGGYSDKGYFYITVDLEKTYHLDKFVTYTASKYAGAGVTGPASVAVYVSDDGESWLYAGKTNPVDTDQTSMLEIVIEPQSAVYGRYVQYRYAVSGAFVMVAETEAYEAHIDPHEHTAGEWIEVKQPTAAEDGKSIRTCNICGETVEFKAIPMLDSSKYGKNLVLGMEYERTGLYQKDGKDRYPDEGGKSMTDGVVGPDNATYASEAFMGFYARHEEYTKDGYFHITFDLKEEYELWRFTTYYAASTAHNSGAGVQEPASVSVYVSPDGTDWNLVGSEIPAEVTDKGVASTDFLFENAVTARYVQFRYTAKKTFVMPSETEVYGFALEQDEILLGDVDGDGTLNAKDYMMLKRHILGTFAVDEEFLPNADIDGDGTLNAKDYMMLKRHILGTYDIFAK